ncbi:glyoxylase-like metal-dependent hydrolase (beta-lactamase superfamily II) [Kribbella amoyensis]|uniref:Glyoxylase-like metal-dependent hydrolase (Beta-lactamase superfamily II) n=1 Tax=Kribbella amoyensis TaxID=996641 RepID=A0A561BWR2_9ACTN|nr:MBL fold metallo-hydrolase [Kribbella amoyensis]TWD83319.1 glyoxylase-like metal-dependent hydrolase (beta-lactamase superfamily II) [Kribbella amoyensis]
MELVELTPRLHLLLFAVGQAYLWQDRDQLTLIDTGPIGVGDAIRLAIQDLGRRPEELTRIVLTHAHGDHAGSAAEIRTWSDADLLAHHADAPLVEGLLPVPPPVLRDWERPLYAQVDGHLAAPPIQVDRELGDGDVLDFGGGAQVVWIPGHTAGSIAVHLPQHGVLLTGDAVAEHGGDVILGVFNQDLTAAAHSLSRLAGLDTELLGFGHGDPVLTHGTKRLRELALVSHPEQ